MNESFFSTLDYIYISIMLISTVLGFSKGFTRVFLSLCAWAGGGFVSIIISPHVYALLKERFSDPNIARAMSGGLSYIIAMAVLLVIVGIISDYIKQSALSGLDRAAGTMFGLLRGMVLPFCVCLIFLILDIDRKGFAMLRNSKISDAVFGIITAIAPNLEKHAAVQSILQKQKEMRKRGMQFINDEPKQLKETMKASTIKIIKNKN